MVISESLSAVYPDCTRCRLLLSQHARSFLLFVNKGPRASPKRKQTTGAFFETATAEDLRARHSSTAKSGRLSCAGKSSEKHECVTWDSLS